jgi:cytochrome c oxidase subunit 2
VIGAIAGGVAAAVALLLPWLPPVASKEGERIDFTFWFVTWICIAVFAVVAAVLITALLEFRVPLDDEEDGPPIHGNTRLEIIWTAIPAILVTAISIVSAIVLADNAKASGTGKTLRVHVYAQQFAWTFQYDDYKKVSLPNLYLEKGQSVELILQSRDVIHSFWVPQFRQKQDLLPDQPTKLFITPTKTGEFPVICTELCGLGHAAMRTRAIVMAPGKLASFLTDAAKPHKITGASGLALFTGDLGCSGCHALSAAKSTATLGPDLDNLVGDAKRAGKPLEAFIRESILTPQSYIEKGCQDQMPHNFKELIQPPQLDALVAFLAQNGKKTTPKGCNGA